MFAPDPFAAFLTRAIATTICDIAEISHGTLAVRLVPFTVIPSRELISTAVLKPGLSNSYCPDA